MHNILRKAVDPGRQISANLILAHDPWERNTLLRDLDDQKLKPKVRIKRIDQELQLPRYETEGSVGFDLPAREDLTVQPGEIKLIPSNVIIEVPRGYALILASRSSTPKKYGLMKPHGIGVIDLDYCGPNDEIKIQVYNFTDKEIQIKKGDRIAQGLFMRVDRLEFEEVTEIKPDSRGGFGSTGESVT
ncbi:MAG: dUTP diphosphatase [Patescibacteria group bacterium]